MNDPITDDLRKRLEGIMRPDAIEPWLDTPNSVYGGETPRRWTELHGPQLMEEMILGVEHGMFS
jgi:hypothetical protein